jgi:hypothetical protein
VRYGVIAGRGKLVILLDVSLGFGGYLLAASTESLRGMKKLKTIHLQV